MARQLFISQDTLVAWQDQEKIDFDGHVMTIKADGRSFNLLEAVRFIRLEGEGQDTAGMLGKVKTDEQLVALGAERYRDSVLIGETAYKVQEGFIGEVFVRGGAAESDAAQAAPAAAPSPAAAPPPPAEEVSGQAIEESVRRAAARRAAAATAQAGDKPVRAAVLRLPLQHRDLAAARTQPALPVVGEAGAAPPAAAPPAPAAEKPPAGPGEASDEDLLTRFLLENL